MSHKKKDTTEKVQKEKEQTEETVECTEETVENAEAMETDQEETKADETSETEKMPEKDPRDVKLEELNDRLIRNMAEFDNFRKRSEKEKNQMCEVGAKSIVEKILPVVDNFERGLGAVTEEEKESAFVQGIEQIYKQFINALEEVGVKPIEAVGQEFNPDYHNAVMHGEDENYGENVISDEFQKGYMYKDSVVRHSMVKVMN